ncbi:MAG: hypothetical protein P8Y52_03790, partial [Xanthomonadales bacterium]
MRFARDVRIGGLDFITATLLGNTLYRGGLRKSSKAKLALALLFAGASLAHAQEVFLDPTLCAEDVSNVGNCSANEVSLSSPTNVVITDVDGNVLTECVEGQQIKIGTLTAELDSNTGTRYDVTFWIGKLGNDPRLSTGAPACTALSLPEDSGSPFIDNFEPTADGCLDFAKPDAPIELTFGGGDAIFTCSNSNAGEPEDIVNGIAGNADLQVVTTWWQNSGFVCGTGDPALSPGSPSKCDFTRIELVPMVEADLSFVKTVLDVDGEGAAGAVDEAGDVITYQLEAQNNGTAILTNFNVGDPLFENFDPLTDCSPLNTTSLAPGAGVICLGKYTATQYDLDSNGDGDGDIDNQAFASSSQTGIVNDTAAGPVVQNNQLTLVKSATP